MEEKLNRWQIEYEAVAHRVIMEGEQNNPTRVVHGYPNMVMYRENP